MAKFRRELQRELNEAVRYEKVDEQPHSLLETNPHMNAISMAQQIQNAVRTEVSRLAEGAGLGGFDEEDDFEDPAEMPDALTGHQVLAMDQEGFAEFLDGNPDLVAEYFAANPVSQETGTGNVAGEQTEVAPTTEGESEPE